MGVGLGQLLEGPRDPGKLVGWVLGDETLDFVEDGQVSWDSVSAHLLVQAEEGVSPGHDQRAGILGPADVAPDRDTASGQFAYYGNDGLILESMGNFSSFRANTCVYSGKWMYEVTLHTSGIQQLGWCTVSCPFTAEEGVGDAPDSYAYDGKRTRKWSVKASPYGQTWAAGDVIGCCLDLDAGEMSFYRNGTPLGVAFSGIRKLQHTQLAFFPAASISYAEKCELNFGGLPFQYPVEGFQPLQHGPSLQESSLASHLTSCLARLSRLCVDPSVAAADSAAHPPTSHPLPPSLSPSSSSFPPFATVGGAAAQGGMGPEGGSSSSNSSAYGSGVTEAPYMGDGLGLDEQKLHLGEGRGVCGSSSSSSGGMAWTDVLLLARAICEHLGPLLVGTFVPPSSSQQPMAVDGESSTAGPGPRSRQCSSYHVGGALLQTLMGLHGRGEPHAPGPTLLLMQLLNLTLPQRAFTQIARALLECLAGRAASAPLKSDQFPYSAAYPWLSLVSCLIQLQPLRTAWFSHPDLQLVLERCLTRKPPSTDDLRTLLPMVWWPGCKDEGASREGMEDAMAKFSATLAKVESRQVCIVAWLAGRSATGLDPSAREDALLTFLRGLVLKNRGATRDVPPPGLSDPTVLISVFSALLRLLRPALAHATSLPAGDMFVKNTSRGDADPSNELTRLGGIVSHLKREHPLSPPELEPLWLAPSELPPPDVAQEVAAQPALRSCPGILRNSAAPHTMQVSGMASYDSGMLSAGGVADQQQGWLQSLHPCARLLLGCGAVCSSGDVIAGAEGEDCGPEWGLLARFKRSWIPELINTALILYSWRVGLSLKTVSTISNNLSASIQNLNEVERQMSRVHQQQRAHEQQQHWEREQQQQAAAAAGEEEDWAPDIERREGGLGTEAGRRRGRQTPGQQLQETLNYLQEARNVLREDVSSNVRYMRLLKAVFFSGWKQEALLALSGWLSRGLLASSDKGALLGYMPSVYMEVVMDVMNTLCKSEDEDLSQLLLRSSAQQPTRTITQPITEPQGGPEPMDTTGPDGEEDGGQQGYTPALLDSVHMLVGVLADPRVAHPDAKEQIMATLTTMLGHRIILGAVEEVELHPRAGKGPRFVSMVVTAFDSQDWHPITNLLKRITVGHGFGHQGLHAGKLVAEKKAGAIRPGSRQGSGPYPSPVLQGMMAEVLSSGSEASKRFLNRLFSTLGWALTEFSVTVSDLWEAINPAPPPPLPPAVAASIGSSTARRPPPQQHMLTEQQQLRRAGLMYDLAVTLLHVLEFVACAAPRTFLASEVNMGRLMEVLPFALSHFAAGPDARRLSSLLQQYGGTGDGGSNTTEQQQREAQQHAEASSSGGSGSGGGSTAAQQQRQPGGGGTAPGEGTPLPPTGSPATSAAGNYGGASGSGASGSGAGGSGAGPGSGGAGGGEGGAQGAQPPAQTPATPAGAPPAAPSAPPSAAPAAPTPATPAALSSILGGLPTGGLVLDASAAAPGGTIADQLAAVLPSGGGLNLGGGVTLRVVGGPGGIGGGGVGGLLAGRDRLLGGAGSRAAAVAAAAAAGGDLGGVGGGGLRGGQRAMERQILVNKVSRAIALAPIVGILVALWRVEKEQQKQQQLGSTSSSASPSSSFLPSLVSGCGRKLLQDELAYMLTIDWGKAGLEGPTLEEEWADFRQLCKEAQEQTSAMEAAEGAAALPEPPDEFVDPITASIMSDPVTLPDSQVTVDRSTVERHLLSQATDPFSRKPLTIAMVVPNTALAARIQRWKATGGEEDTGAA